MCIFYNIKEYKKILFLTPGQVIWQLYVIAGEKRACAKFQVVILKTERLLRISSVYNKTDGHG